MTSMLSELDRSETEKKLGNKLKRTIIVGQIDYKTALDKNDFVMVRLEVEQKIGDITIILTDNEVDDLCTMLQYYKKVNQDARAGTQN